MRDAATAGATRVAVGPLALHVEQHGGGAPLLLLHGFAGSARTMRPLIDALAERHRVIAPDLPGHGLSDAPREAAAYTWSAATRHLVRLLDALDVPDAHVVGFSLGGRIALQLAARHPERVRAACTIGSRCVWTDSVERSARRATDAALATRIETEGMRAFARGEQGSHAVAHDDALAAAAPGAGTHGLALALRGLGAADQPAVGADLAVSAVPLLLLAGENDPGPLAAAHALADDLPAARAVAIAGAGHRAHLERTQEVARLALDFFAAADAAETGDDLETKPRTRRAAAAEGDRRW